MASPPYQDWSKYIVPSADVILSDEPPVTSLYTGPIEDCSAWSHILIGMHNIDTATHYRCDITWRGYNASLFGQAVNYFVVGPGDFVSMTMPIHGRQLGMEWVALDNTPSLPMIYAILGMNHPMTKYEASLGLGVLLSVGQLFPANANIAFPLNFWYEGPATLSVSTDAGANAIAVLEEFDAGTGGWIEYMHMGILNDVATIPYHVMIPPTDVRVHIYNTGTPQTVRINMMIATN